MPRRADLNFAEENELILCVLCLDFVLFIGHRGTPLLAKKKKKTKKKGRTEV